MPVQLNHTIVAARDKRATARFFADTLGLTVGDPYGPFLPVETSNQVTLDFADTPAEQIAPQHYAFLVSEDEFDAIFTRIQHAGVAFYADPRHRGVGRINHHDGGRGLYFADPNGHNLEIITRPEAVYAGGPGGAERRGERACGAWAPVGDVADVRAVDTAYDMPPDGRTTTE